MTTWTPQRVVAVVVTHDRRDLLLGAIEAVTSQSSPPADVVVVDNASQDGTAEAVRARFPAVHLVELPHNTGGAGGFAAGICVALEQHDADLVWLMDDDTVPTPTALEALLAVRDGHGDPRPAVLASRVVWHDGRDHPMNTPRRRVGSRRHDSGPAAGRPIRSASFVSVLVDADAIKASGLPVADYFIWNDDFEFTSRLLRRRMGIWVPDSVVVHRTKMFGTTDADPGERFYYEVRNKLWTFTRSSALGAGDRILYSGSTLARWARTIARSRDRRTLVRALRRGLRDGIATRPRPTGSVLADVGISSALGEECRAVHPAPPRLPR